jgi:hypothetical protein
MILIATLHIPVTLNPPTCLRVQRLDHYDFANDASRAYPESHVLHLTNATKIALKSRDVGEQNLTFAPGDRFQFLVWNDRYVVFNLKNPVTHQWNIHRLLSDLDGVQGLFLDAHAHDFPTVIGITTAKPRSPQVEVSLNTVAAHPPTPRSSRTINATW